MLRENFFDSHTGLFSVMVNDCKILKIYARMEAILEPFNPSDPIGARDVSKLPEFGFINVHILGI